MANPNHKRYVEVLQVLMPKGSTAKTKALLVPGETVASFWRDYMLRVLDGAEAGEKEREHDPGGRN